MKMVAMLKTILVIALATTVRCEEVSKEEVTPKGAAKPFFYGRKFQLAKDSSEQKGELYSPLITSPIRTLPAYLDHDSKQDAETLKHNQNEIFTNIRDLFRETSEGSFNKTYFLEEATEEENHGGEATTESPRGESSGEANSSASKSRQDGDRSLLVVLPFKADENNVQELFTKSPLVKVIENDEADDKSGKTVHPPVTREITPTTTTETTIFGGKKQWRPFKRFRTTTDASTVETTTENEEEVTKVYTNYNDAEMVTKKFENFGWEPQNTNHKLDTDFVTPYPIYKRSRNKTKKEEVTSEQPEEKTTTEDVQTSTTAKPKLKLKRKGQRRKPTTEGPPKPEELSKVLDILPPDMKDLILQIGLNKESKEQQASSNNFRLERPPQPTIDPKSYAVFKPLPLEGQDENRNFVPDDMKDFLASFGLLPVGRRVQKSLKTPEIPENKTRPVEKISGVYLEFLPDDLKSLLEEMGFVKDPDKKEPTRIHIFNPSNHSIAHSEEDIEKLNAILSSIKTTVNESQSLTPEMQSEIIAKIRELNNLRYKNGNLSEINNEIKKIVVNGDGKAKTPAKRATKLLDGPDPVMFSEESLLKNDVKRQDTSSSSASSSASASASSSASESASSSASASASSSSSSSSASSSSSSSSSSSASSDSVASSASGSESAADTTTTEEAPNIEALKESFGGGETASDDADIESSLPPKRPNGLYLLLDWNTFLEVGTDDDNRKVNLRFQPKIGDSRNFLPVSVP